MMFTVNIFKHTNKFCFLLLSQGVRNISIEHAFTSVPADQLATRTVLMKEVCVLEVNHLVLSLSLVMIRNDNVNGKIIQKMVIHQLI